MVSGSFRVLPPLKPGRHDIVETLLKVALNTKNSSVSTIVLLDCGHVFWTIVCHFFFSVL
jgi:hypothetical protein